MRALVPISIMLSFAVLAGCASNDTTTPPANGATPTPGSAIATNPGPTTNPGGTTSPGDAATLTPWGAYRFDETVDPRSGSSGKIDSYSFTHTNEADGKTTMMDVAVDVLGVSTETVRGQTFDFSSGATEPTTATAQVEVAKLRHTITVKQDDTGERKVGDTAVATLWLPTSGSTTLASIFPFVHLDYTEGSSTGVWETLPQTTTGTASMSVPFTEGDDPSSWWGFQELMTAYALSAWAGIFEDTTLEEGTHGFGGFTYTASREPLSVTGYTFDGWRVTWSVASGGDSGGYTVAVAPELPLPFEHSFESTSGGVANKISYKLTALRLG